MFSKCALVVDDSKIARLALSRILQERGLVVDTAVSAEQALEYLIHKRPDAIFMDHGMPGMDGFQAVKAIKENPLTATIPIMMYTAQQGEVYVGQARALGAVGVLPKNNDHLEVTKVLESLRLIKPSADKTQTDSPDLIAKTDDSVKPKPDFTSTAAPSSALLQNGVVYKQIRELINDALNEKTREQRKDFRRDLIASQDLFVKKVISELKPVDEPLPPPPEASPRGGLTLSTVLMGLLALTFSGLYYSESRQVGQMDEKTSTLLQEVADLRTQLTYQQRQSIQLAGGGSQTGTTPQFAIDGDQENQLLQLAALRELSVLDQRQKITDSIVQEANQKAQYQYRSTPLDDERLDTLRELLAKLREVNFNGVVLIEIHTGIFCLSGDGNSADAYVLARDDMLLGKCDVRGNPTEESLGPWERQSIAFADFLGSPARLTDKNIRVDVELVGSSRPLLEYPVPFPELTAGAWNKVAASNNRVSFSVQANEQTAQN